MKFGVLALDYDGTIARDGALDPDVKAAILEARGRGIVVVLVSGRILSDLRQAAGDLGFVDAVVAENGAVLAFPNGQIRLIGHLPSQIFLDELRRRRIEFMAGQCIVETDAAWAPQILEVIRQLELPLVLLFNRSRLMILPQAISDGPRAVAAYIQRASQEMKLPLGRSDRHQMALGAAEDGCPIALAVHGRDFLVVGDPQSGKSWANGLACEQLILQGYCVCLIDPEGDYGTLESLPGVVVLGGEEQPPEIPEVARALQHFDLSVVVDLSRILYEDKVRYLNALLPMLASLRRSTGLPHRIVIDEAHYFLRESNVKQLLDMELGAYTLVTYRPSDLHPDLRRGIEAVIVKRLTHAQEVQTLLTMVGNQGVEQEWTRTLGALADDEAALLPGIDEAEGKLRRFKLAPRLTPHVRHKTKYLDLQLVGGQEFVFTDNGNPVGPPARSLKQFVLSLPNIPAASLDGHTRRGDFSRWIDRVFHDHRLASDVRKVEQRYRLGHLDDVRQSMTRVIEDRYKFSHDKVV